MENTIIKNSKNKYVAASFIIVTCGAMLVSDAKWSTIIGTALVLIFSWVEFRSLRPLGFNKGGFQLKQWLLVIGITFILIFVFVGLLILIPLVTGVPIDYSYFDQIRGNTTAYLISIPIVWIMGGFFEEIIFRGFLINQLTRIFGDGKLSLIFCVFSTSVFFGYLHGYQGLSGQIVTGIIGGLLATLYILNKRKLWLNILVHGLLDTVGMTLFYFSLDKYFI